MNVTRISLRAFNGVAHPAAVEVDPRGRWFTVETKDVKRVLREKPVPTDRPAAAPRTFALPTWPCVHRGAQDGATLCSGCGGKTLTLPVFTCVHHGQCTVERLSKTVGLACCKVCKDREEPKNALELLLKESEVGALVE